MSENEKPPTPQQLAQVGQVGLDTLRAEMEKLGRALANAGDIMAPFRTMAEAVARGERRRQWDAQHERAVNGDQAAVLYLLRNERP